MGAVIAGIKRIGTALVSAAREAAKFEQASQSFRNLAENAGFAADVSVERVQEISEEEATREGIVDGGCLNCGCPEPCRCNDPHPDRRDAFIYLWDSINAKRGYGWDRKPWVWVVSF